MKGTRLTEISWQKRFGNAPVIQIQGLGRQVSWFGTSISSHFWCGWWHHTKHCRLAWKLENPWDIYFWLWSQGSDRCFCDLLWSLLPVGDSVIRDHTTSDRFLCPQRTKLVNLAKGSRCGLLLDLSFKRSQTVIFPVVHLVLFGSLMWFLVYWFYWMRLKHIVIKFLPEYRMDLIDFMMRASQLLMAEGEAMLNMMICARTRMHRRLQPDLLLATH